MFRLGLAGKTELENFEADIVVDTIEDAIRPVYQFFRLEDGDKRRVRIRITLKYEIWNTNNFRFILLCKRRRLPPQLTPMFSTGSQDIKIFHSATVGVWPPNPLTSFVNSKARFCKIFVLVLGLQIFLFRRISFGILSYSETNTGIIFTD